MMMDTTLLQIRTQMKWSDIRTEYMTERRFLKEWDLDPAKAHLSKPADVPTVTNAQLRASRALPAGCATGHR